MPTLPAKIRAARAGLGLSQETLADEAGLHENTLRGIEHNRPVTYEFLLQCQEVLEGYGIEFIEHGGRHGLIFPATLAAPNAAALRGARAAMIMQQTEVAVLTNLTMGTLRRIESGQGSVRSTYIDNYILGLGTIGVDIAIVATGVQMRLPPVAALRAALEGRGH